MEVPVVCGDLNKCQSCGQLGISSYLFQDFLRSLTAVNMSSWFFPLPILIGLFPAAVDLRVRGTLTRGAALVWE